MRRQDCRDDLLAQALPGRRIAEEAGHADEQFFEEKLSLLRALL